MAFYRCGGGGIPSSLKTDMNAVLNKKFGTSQDYPPTDWAPSVNLLGPLPEKTVSGSVANITDGADGVPIKAWEVTLPASLLGYSSINGTQNTGTGTPETQYTISLGRTIYGGQVDIVNGIAEPTNYLDTANAETNTNNSVSITCDGKGKYTATGTATGGSANITFTLKTPCEIKSGDYFHCGNSVANGSVSITLQKQDNTSIVYFALSPINRIVDLSSYAGQTIYSIRFYVANGASFEMTLTPMLCYNSAVTPYSPYFTPFTFTGQEIPTRLGYNAFWSDQGDTEVTYRADINLALGGQ